jgi:micrococcal nuclease
MINEEHLYYYKANVIEVYDGDTVTLDVDFGCNIWQHDKKCRLYGIDTPELRGSKEEKAKGRKSRDRLRELILGEAVFIKTHKDKTGKYGRLLVTIYIDGVDINDLLVKEGLAKVKFY